jgi:hypothetical protein
MPMFAVWNKIEKGDEEPIKYKDLPGSATTAGPKECACTPPDVRSADAGPA